MFYRTDAKLLSFGWSERNLYAFVSIESFACIIALYRFTTMGTLKRFEEKISALKSLRTTPVHMVHDDYGKLRTRMLIQSILIPIFFILTSTYLVANQIVLFDTTQQSAWYFYYDAGVSLLCGYVNVLYLPVHSILHHGMAREFEVFNEELENASKNKELSRPTVIRAFGDRQVQLFEFTNHMTSRLTRMMNYAPFSILTATANVTFLVFSVSSQSSLLYWFCLLGEMIACTLISSSLLYPPAYVQETMLKTSTILMSDASLQHSPDASVYQSYRMMVDRSLHNRTTNTVIHVFSVTRKNVERAYFVITQIVLVMTVFYNLTFP
ncbi:unnamed protein product [Caenorhabditis sp. 36 PRJEB53466]|nr:unnamed protein product [Caenorhabditis sp. 36 PRJEB53466]